MGCNFPAPELQLKALSSPPSHLGPSVGIQPKAYHCASSHILLHYGPLLVWRWFRLNGRQGGGAGRVHGVRRSCYITRRRINPDDETGDGSEE